jgi:hypothetical protein
VILDQDEPDTFRLARLRFPEKTDNEYFESSKCPIDEELLEVLYQELAWDDIQWGNTSIELKKEKMIEGLRSFKYYKK